MCYTQYVEITDQTIDVLLGALADQLQALGSRVEIVVIGWFRADGSRPCQARDQGVDLLAIAENGELRLAEPLPQALVAARANVAADFGLAEDWLNPGPTDLLKWGLPEAFMSRVVTRYYGTALTVHFAAGSTRFTSSSLPWLTRAEGDMRPISARSTRLRVNSLPPRGGQ